VIRVYEGKQDRKNIEARLYLLGSSHGLSVPVRSAFAIARRIPKRKPPPEQHLITSLTYFQIVQKLQDNVKNNKGLYFICFLCKFVRGEGVVRVVGGL
jgi:hypothetical protein